MNEFLDQVYFENTVRSYLIALGAIILAWIILKLLKGPVINAVKKATGRSKTHLDDHLVNAVVKYLMPFTYLVINYNIITQLNLSDKIHRILSVVVMVVITYYLAAFVNHLVQRSFTGYMKRRGEPDTRIKQMTGILMIVKAVIWIIALLMLFDNLGYNVTTVLTGLGIGGIAVALAAQNILGDLFSYFVIFFDKPFKIGDYIVTGDSSGVVEKIGIKTSHVRSLEGQLLIMPNADLAKSVVHNYKKLFRRRVVFKIGVTYQTPSHKLREIPAIIKEIISRTESATFDRSFFKGFGDFSIDYEIVYYIESDQYNVFAEIHQNICLTIFEKFEKEKIDFAYPTQVVLFSSDANTEKAHPLA